MLRRTVFFCACLLTVSHALGHTKLARSMPAEGASIEPPVEELVLEFEEPVRLTVLTLVDAAGVAKHLSPVPADVAARFVLAVHEPLAAGAYVATWRAIGADTHIVSGEISFHVTAPAR